MLLRCVDVQHRLTVVLEPGHAVPEMFFNAWHRSQHLLAEIFQSSLHFRR